MSPQAPPGLIPGQDWPRLRVGTPYVLAADVTDGKYRVETRRNVITERRVSLSRSVEATRGATWVAGDTPGAAAPSQRGA